MATEATINLPVATTSPEGAVFSKADKRQISVLYRSFLYADTLGVLSQEEWLLRIRAREDEVRRINRECQEAAEERKAAKEQRSHSLSMAAIRVRTKLTTDQRSAIKANAQGSSEAVIQHLESMEW